MQNSNTTKNQKTTIQGRDLGQIVVKKHPDGKYYAWLEGGNRTWSNNCSMPDGEISEKSYWIDYGMQAMRGERFTACIQLAELTSKSKFDRDLAKQQIKEWATLGKAVMEALQQAIDAKKAEDAALSRDAEAFWGGGLRLP